MTTPVVTPPADQVPVDSTTESDTVKRLPSSRRSLTVAFITVAILAVVALGAVNIYFARDALNGVIDAQLTSLKAERAVAINDALERVRDGVSVVAADQSVAASLRDLADGFTELEADGPVLDPSQEQELEDFYQQALDSYEGPDAPSLDAMLPESAAGRYLQYYYIAANPNDADHRANLLDAGDGSDYSAAHALHHEALAQRAESVNAVDLLLISSRADDLAGTIVYSTNKRVDYATSLLDGPYDESTLASTIINDLAAVPVGDAILVDLEPYFPGNGQPTMFAAAAVRDESEVIGAVAVALRPDFLDSLTTFDAKWSEIGLGKSGEIYLVGPDNLMRSVSRFWVEDPEAYAKTVADQGYDPEVLSALDRHGSTVLAQPVDTEAVNIALEDRPYSGTTDNYLGTKTLTEADPLGVPGLNWVIVAGFSSSDASQPIKDYLWALGLIALILVPLVAVLGIVMARKMTKPILPLAETVTKITNGDVSAEVPPQGRNEYGNLGNRINALTAMLRQRDEERAATDHAINEVLLAALPERLVTAARQAVKNGGEATPAAIGDLMDTCTVIAISLSGYFNLDTSEAEQNVSHSVTFARDVEQLATDLGIERVRSAPEEYLFAAGLNTPDFETDAAARFVQSVVHRITALPDETEVEGSYRIGMSAGRVVAGLQSGTQLSYGIWGTPVKTARLLAGLAKSDEVLVDDAVAESIGDGLTVEPAHRIGLSGATIDAFVVSIRDSVEQ